MWANRLNLVFLEKEKSATPVFASGCGFVWWMIRGSNPGHPAGLETTLYLLIIYYFL